MTKIYQKLARKYSLNYEFSTQILHIFYLQVECGIRAAPNLEPAWHATTAAHAPI